MLIIKTQRQSSSRKQIVNAQSIVIFSLKYLLTKQISRVWSLGIFALFVLFFYFAAGNK